MLCKGYGLGCVAVIFIRLKLATAAERSVCSDRANIKFKLQESFNKIWKHYENTRYFESNKVNMLVFKI